MLSSSQNTTIMNGSEDKTTAYLGALLHNSVTIEKNSCFNNFSPILKVV